MIHAGTSLDDVPTYENASPSHGGEAFRAKAMPVNHDYGKTRAFTATCPGCNRETRGLSTDGRVKTIVRSCSNPPCQARGIILSRDKTKDGPIFRAKPFSCGSIFTAEVRHWLTNALVGRFVTLEHARQAAAALTGPPPSRYNRKR